MSIEFKRGDRVEVSANQDGFQGSYFEATIISKIGDGEFIVEYRSLLRDDKLAPLREIIGGRDIRPRPPAQKVNDFEMRDEVDAWDNDGWWRGTVVKRWRRGDKRYEVFFKGTGDKKSYHMPNLRVHFDFVDGRWVKFCNKRLRD